MLKSTRILVAIGMTTVALMNTASVDAWGNARQTTYLTFSAPFALPGVSLPAGTYIFELPLCDAAVDLVRVKSRDGTQVYVTAYTRIVGRPAHLRSDRQILFNEVPSGMAPQVKAWYPDGQSIGHEFLYPANSRHLGE